MSYAGLRGPQGIDAPSDRRHPSAAVRLRGSVTGCAGPALNRVSGCWSSTAGDRRSTRCRACRPATCSAAADPDRYDLRVVGITTEGRWVDTTAALGSGLPAGALPSPDASSRTAIRPPRWSPSRPSPSGPRPAGGAAAAARAHGRGRLRPGAAGGGRSPVLRSRGGRLGGGHGQGHGQGAAGAAGLPQARYLFFRETEVDAGLAERVDADAGVAGVREARQHGLVDRDFPGARRRRSWTPPSTWPGASTSSSSSRRPSGAGSSRSGCSGGRTCGHQCPARSFPVTTSTTSTTSTSTATAGLEVPARLPAGVAEEMGRLAVAACRALRVDCMARVDFFYEEGGRGLLVNEVNTIPGFTPISMYPRLWEASGVPVPGAGRRAGRPGPPTCGAPGRVRDAPPVSRVARHRSAAGWHAMTPCDDRAGWLTAPPGPSPAGATRDSCPWPWTPAAPAAGHRRRSP